MDDKKPQIRYTKGPDELGFGSTRLVRADLEATSPAEGKAPAYGWRDVSNDIALEALRPGHVAEYGFQARGYTVPEGHAHPIATLNDDGTITAMEPAQDAAAESTESATTAGRRTRK